MFAAIGICNKARRLFLKRCLLSLCALLTLDTAGAAYAQGDGYRPIPYNGRIYVVNHHAKFPLQYLACFDASSGQICLGYPAGVPATAGQAFTTGDTGLITSQRTVEYLNPATGRIYFPVQRLAGGDVGFLCADLNTRTSCGFTVLETGVPLDIEPLFPAAMLTGAEPGTGKIYAATRTGRLYCMNLATQTACAGQPFATGVTRNYIISNCFIDDFCLVTSLRLGNRLYVTWPNTGGATSDVTCFDTATDTACPGWPRNIPHNANILYPVLDTSGTPTGLCVVKPSTAGVTCLNLDGSSYTSPVSFSAFVTTNVPGLSQYGFHDAGVYQTRVFTGADLGGTQTRYVCYDWNNLPSGACSGYTPPTFNASDWVYAIIADATRPGCMWAYGDTAHLRAWNASDGGACAISGGGAAIPTLSESMLILLALLALSTGAVALRRRSS